MTFFIQAPHDVTIIKDDEVFLIIKRKFAFGIKCSFFRDDQLIFESFIFPFLLPFLKIRYQNLAKEVLLRRKKGLFYSAFHDDVEFSIKLKLFRNPDYLFFKNGIKHGYLTHVKNTFGRNSTYKLETDLDNIDENIVFIILLLAHIRLF